MQETGEGEHVEHKRWGLIAERAWVGHGVCQLVWKSVEITHRCQNLWSEELMVTLLRHFQEQDEAMRGRRCSGGHGPQLLHCPLPPQRSWDWIRVQPGAKKKKGEGGTETRKSGKRRREVFTHGLIIFFPPQCLSLWLEVALIRNKFS